MTNRPLSHTKRGKLLAAIGGLAGGPLGVIVSPLVLMLINASKKEGNRFLIWFLLGMPISAGLWFIQAIIISVIGLSTGDLSGSKSNGMETWSEIEEAQHKDRHIFCAKDVSNKEDVERRCDIESDRPNHECHD